MSEAKHMTKQITLDGDTVDEKREPRSGSAVILWHAPADTDLAKLGHWIKRAREEGVLTEGNHGGGYAGGDDDDGE